MTVAALLALLVGVSWCSAQVVSHPDPDPNPHRHGGGPPLGLHILHPNIHPPTGKIPEDGQVVTFDSAGLGSPVILDRNWRLGLAEGVEPAQPDFDDSKWPVSNAKDALAELDESDTDDDSHPENGKNGGKDGGNDGHGHHSGHRPPWAWFRIHIQLPAKHGPLAVLVRLPISRTSQISVGQQTIGLDLFANGKQVIPNGPNAKTPEAYQQISRIYPIDIADGETSLVLAVRIPFVPFGMDAYTGFFSNRTFFLGERDDLNAHLDLWKHASLFERLPELIDNGLKVLLALFLLALFWTQRGHPEYLWLGLHLLIVAPIAYVDLVGSSAQLEKLTMAALVMQLLLVSGYFYFEFLVAFLSLRIRWYIRALRYTSPILITFAPLILLIHHGRAIEIALAVSVIGIILWMIAWVIFTGLTLTIAAVKRNYEAALLLLPLLLSLVGMLELTSTASTSWMNGSMIQSPLTFSMGPVPIHFSAIADFVGVLVIIVIVFVRFLRIHRERERASSELAAARSVQELMIPMESPSTPGFQVDTVYTPANEVGGDFFHIQATGNGGLLVVIGDVAGKGLQAAMTVSMLMGALRRSPQTEPGEILASLNNVLAGSPGLTTCEAAHFFANGEVSIASAGHPPPYLNSQEVTLPGGLPLGVVPNLTYDESAPLPAPRRPPADDVRWRGRGAQIKWRTLRL